MRVSLIVGGCYQAMRPCQKRAMPLILEDSLNLPYSFLVIIGNFHFLVAKYFFAVDD